MSHRIMRKRKKRSNGLWLYKRSNKLELRGSRYSFDSFYIPAGPDMGLRRQAYIVTAYILNAEHDILHIIAGYLRVIY